MNYMVPTLSLQEIVYGMSDATCGLGFALIAFCAVIMAPTWGKMTTVDNSRYICIYGLFFLTIGIYLTGPGKPLPGKLWIMLIGLSFLGIGTSAVQVVSLSTLIEFVGKDVVAERHEEGL